VHHVIVVVVETIGDGAVAEAFFALLQLVEETEVAGHWVDGVRGGGWRMEESGERQGGVGGGRKKERTAAGL
jgi:hypothetical protein